MMKFPVHAAVETREFKLLTDIWETVGHELKKHGLTGRRADERAYEDQLWENICVYMLSSRYGIAILEDRAANELNPNVMLEYGFMRAMNRRVALLRDVNFKHDRADLTGKLARPFEIDKSSVLRKASLRSAVRDWLSDVGLGATNVGEGDARPQQAAPLVNPEAREAGIENSRALKERTQATPRKRTARGRS
jgi:hypothetical protein